MMAQLRITDTLKAISDDKSLVLFNTIALSSGNTDILISRLGLSTKQYYSRMSDLVKAGLIMRKSGRNYFLTSFGKVVYEAHVLIGKGIQNYWKLRAIDSIETFSAEERGRFIDTLIESSYIKKILFDTNSDITTSADTRKINNNQELITSAPPRAHSTKTDM
jgi:predicted transcriptional regulator